MSVKRILSCVSLLRITRLLTSPAIRFYFWPLRTQLKLDLKADKLRLFGCQNLPFLRRNKWGSSDVRGLVKSQGIDFPFAFSTEILLGKRAKVRGQHCVRKPAWARDISHCGLWNRRIFLVVYPLPRDCCAGQRHCRFGPGRGEGSLSSAEAQTATVIINEIS